MRSNSSVQVRFLPGRQITNNMKIIDNFDLFREKMNWNSPDEFYFVQILIRRKDGHIEPGVNGNNINRLIKFYTIGSLTDLDKYENEIKSICEAINGRVYVHPTKRSFNQIADECLRITTDMYLSKTNNVGLKAAYSTACGKSFINSDKKYVIDLDDDAVNQKAEIIEFIEYHCEPFNCVKFQYEVPTAHGIHLITTKFNRDKFCEHFPNIDVHANNPTLLYFKCLE